MNSKTINGLLNPVVQSFLTVNLDADPAKILMQKKLFDEVENRDIVTQLVARKKAKHKLPAWFNKPGIIFPESLAMEQCSSELTGNYKSTRIPANRTVVDLTGGFGIDSFYLAQQAKSVVYVDQQEYLCTLAKHNFTTFKQNNIEVVHADLSEYLESWIKNPTNLVYCDPARRNEQKSKVFLLEDCSPDLGIIVPLILSHGADLLVKLSPLFDLHRLKDLFGNQVAEFHVVSVKNECKEVLVLLKTDNQITKLFCANLATNHPEVTANWDEIIQAKATIGPIEKFLFEPNASILKAGAGDWFAKQHNLNKLNAHSQLYTADATITNYPGRVFEVKHVVALDKKVLAKLYPKKKVNITCRNFPLSPEQIYKKIGFVGGGDDYLFATTLANNSKAIICCTKVISTERLK